METIGQKLGEARQEAGLSFEDVAHETHIHSNVIQHIEEDDFSTFPSVAYAKSFIRNYAEFLDVDVSSALVALNSGVTVSLGENELMDEMKKTIKKDRRFRLQRHPKSVRRNLEKPGKAPFLLNLILGVLIASLVVFYVLGYSASSPEEAKAEIAKGLQKANPFSEDVAGAATDEIEDRTKETALATSGPVVEESALLESQVASEPQKPSLRAVELNKPVPALPVQEAAIKPPKLADSNLDIEKPSVSWSVEADSPSPLARSGTDTLATPKLRETPAISIEAELKLPSIHSAELPGVREAREETPADLPAADARATTPKPSVATRSQPAAPKEEKREGFFERLRSREPNPIFGKKLGDGRFARKNP